MEDENSDVEHDNPSKSATVRCVQYLISHYMKNKSLIKKDDLMKTVFKGRTIGKNYERVIQDVDNTLKNVFGLTLSFIKDDLKLILIVNNLEEINIPGISLGSTELSKYRILLLPIMASFVLLRQPISEGQMWNILEMFAAEFDLDMNLIKNIVKKDFVRDQYLIYSQTDESTIMFDPERTTKWFSMGPRALVECDQMIALQQVAKLYNTSIKSFKRVYAALNK